MDAVAIFIEVFCAGSLVAAFIKYTSDKKKSVQSKEHDKNSLRRY